MLVKSDSLAAARALSDSLLSSIGSPTPYQAGFLGNLAALTGRAARAASLLQVAASDSEHIPFLDAEGRRLSLPTDLMGAILQLRVYAALDAPRDSVRAVYQRADQLLDRSVAPANRLAMRRRLFGTPIALAGESLSAAQIGTLVGTDDLVAMRAALEAGDARAARVAGARFTEVVSRYSPGTVGPDRLTAYASMLLSLGDTATATRQLDAALYGISRSRSILLAATPQAAAIGRAMLLRAQVAARSGDRATAARWLREVDVLWRGADADLRAPIEDLKRRL
jgi:hypothetical protein